MTSATVRLQEYFTELMTFADTGVTSQEDQILLAGAMMGVAKMLYHNNLTEQEYDNILNHNARDLLNLFKTNYTLNRRLLMALRKPKPKRKKIHIDYLVIDNLKLLKRTKEKRKKDLDIYLFLKETVQNLNDH